mmetsp:Transcript_81944/g.144707  ORF Transcript_81944/g.144707 Transcript_81944/m.144707 type:complete len:220 (-) Transcript_81944:69-728(-)
MGSGGDVGQYVPFQGGGQSVGLGWRGGSGRRGGSQIHTLREVATALRGRLRTEVAGPDQAESIRSSSWQELAWRRGGMIPEMDRSRGVASSEASSEPELLKSSSQSSATCEGGPMDVIGEHTSTVRAERAVLRPVGSGSDARLRLVVRQRLSGRDRVLEAWLREEKDALSGRSRRRWVRTGLSGAAGSVRPAAGPGPALALLGRAPGRRPAPHDCTGAL